MGVSDVGLPCLWCTIGLH